MIFVGNVGTVFNVTYNLNIIGYTAVKIKFIDPLGVINAKTKRAKS